MNTRVVGFATLLVLVAVGQSAGSIVLDLSEDSPFSPLGGVMFLNDSLAFELDPMASVYTFAWEPDGAFGYGSAGSMLHMAGSPPLDDEGYALAFGEVKDVDQPAEASGEADIPFFAAPEPGTLIIWSVLGGLGFGLGWWRGRRHGVELDTVDTSPYEPPDRHAWPEGTTEAILDIIDHGRQR